MDLDYKIHGIHISIPGAWIDKSVHAFVLPSSEGRHGGSFVITRHEANEQTTLDQYVDRCLLEVVRRLNQQRLLYRRATALDEHPAVEVEYSWTTPENFEIVQRQIHLQHGSHFLTFTLSARSADVRKHDVAWQHALASVKLVRGL